MGSINGKLYSLLDLQVAKVKFDAEFGGVDQFLQKGAQHALFRPFGSRWGPKPVLDHFGQVKHDLSFSTHEGVYVHPSFMLYSLKKKPS